MRKIFYLILVLALVSIPALSQERVYISTDKDTYVSGDRVWCSAFCMDASSSPALLSGFSSTVYLELQTNEKVVQTAKIALISGRGAGALELSPDLPTGNYRLIAYTSLNKNEKGFVPDGKFLTIFNVLSGERLETGVVISAGQEPRHSEVKSIAGGNDPSIEVSLPDKSCGTSEKVRFSIKNTTTGSVTLSVSIFHQDNLGVLPERTIAQAFSQMGTIAAGYISHDFIPDYEGEVIKLSTHGISGGMAHISFPGRGNGYYACDIDSSGTAYVFTPNIIGDKDMVCEIEASSMPQSWSIEVVDPFIKTVQGNIPELVIGKYMEERLQNRSFSMQIGHRFDADTLFTRLPVRENTFLDGNKVVYPLDNYTRFPLMEEVIIEFVTQMRVRKVQKEPQILVSVNGPSLILLDGVPVFDHKKILDYDPLLVKDIEIYTGLRSLGNKYYDGVACLNTYKGDLPSYTFPENVRILPFKGALVPLSYTGKGVLDNPNYPDYRETLYWHPVVDIHAGEIFDFECVTPLYPGTFEIVVEGVSEDGKALSYRSSFQVK